jgi:antitoxin component of MazEF toxin-antitoxin module
MITRAVKVQEGDYLEAKIVEGGVLLKPVAVVERQRAWELIQQAAGHVRRNEPLAIEDNEAEEEAIAADVKAMRKTND